MALQYYQVSSIQFWMTDYFIMVLKRGHSETFALFTFVCISAPTTGAILGGDIS